MELIGIERTYQTIEKARIILWLLDEAPTVSEQQEMQTRCEGKELIIVITKSDKGLTVKNDSSFFIPHSSFIAISAKYDTDLSPLEEAIYASANIPDISENDIIITNARHYDALIKANESLSRVINGMKQQVPSDLLAEDLRLTLSHLADITGGQITPQETLNNIFSHFCVGK